MIQPVTRDEILNGLGQDYYCYMFGLNQHEYKCDMWLQVFDEVGAIGFLARDGAKIVGQMIFIAKKYARRIAIPRSSENADIDTTMVIGCLYVLKEYGNRGIASQMIRMLIEFCRDHGYLRIEACVHLGSPGEAGINTSYAPFRKFGFVMEDSREGWELRPDVRMCHVSLSQNGEGEDSSSSSL